MGLRLCYPEETVVIVRDRILEGWILLEADMDFFKRIEEGIYTPGTEKNRGFELVNVGWAGKIFVFALIKKNRELKKFLKMEDKEFKDLVFIRVAVKERLSAYLDLLRYPTKQQKCDFVSNYFENLLEFMENGEVTRKQLKSTPSKRKTPDKKRKTLSKSIRHEVFKRDDYKCVECGATKENTVLHIDHILPVSQGGSDELDNLQTLCEACNLSKSNRAWKGGKKV